MAAGVSLPLLRAQPIQALGPAQWPQDLVGRLTVAAGRLARPFRRHRQSLARGTRSRRPRQREGGAAMNRLDGKVALISGAARGIGAETARLMVEAGAKVAVADVLDERGRETVRALENISGEVTYTHLDVTREEEWTAAITAVTGRFGALDILVNNAGVYLGLNIEEATLADWHRLCAVNLTGVFLGTKLALPALRDSAARSPLGSAIVGSPSDPLYSMTKGGVALFTKSAALEFARKGYKIRVNSIHPGLIETDMGAQVFASRAQELGTNDLDAARRQSLERLPIGRLGTVTDIAKGIVFLASDDAGFMTGAGLVVDGGTTAQ